MTPSPLARIVASTKPAAPALQAVQAVGRATRTTPKDNVQIIDLNRPNFGSFIQKFMDDNKLSFLSYVHTESQTRSTAAKITAALRAKFPGVEVTEMVEGAEYKPPFAVSWSFEPKKAAQ